MYTLPDLQQAKAKLEACKKLLSESGVVGDRLCQVSNQPHLQMLHPFLQLQVLLADLNKAIGDLRDRHAYEERGSHTIASL